MSKIVAVTAWKSEAAVGQDRTSCLQRFMFRRLNSDGTIAEISKSTGEAGLVGKIISLDLDVLNQGDKATSQGRSPTDNEKCQL